MNTIPNENRYSLHFLNTTIHLIVSAPAQPALQLILEFFSTHFDIEPELVGQAEGVLFVYTYGDFHREDYSGTVFTPIVIRESKTQIFNLSGEKAVLSGLEIMDSKNTETAIVVFEKEHKAQLYISENSLFQVVNFIRDIVIRAEERCGTVFLHAAGAIYKGQAIALVGSPGAGKTTTLLNLIARQEFEFLSGDKICIRLNHSEIHAFGWPDYPHIGFGTILSHPKLLATVKSLGHEIDETNLTRKIPLLQATQQAAFNIHYTKGALPLKHIILPSILDSTSSSFGRLKSFDPELILTHLELSFDEHRPCWHKFTESVPRTQLEPVLRELAIRLQQCHCYYLRGTAPLQEADLAVFRTTVTTQ